MVLVEFLIKIVLACKMVDAVSSILNSSVRPQNKEKMHTLYIEEGMMVIRFLCIRNG